jgi:DNA-binding transcriptional MerR regulator
MPETEGYRVPEVCKVVGITYRQLDYWARTELILPSIRDAGGSGTQRVYSFGDLVQLRVIRKLLDAGLTLQKVRKAVEALKDMNEGPTGITLLSDGQTVFAADSPEEIYDLLQKGQGVFAIAVDRVRDDLAGSLGRTATGTGRTTQLRPAKEPAAKTVRTRRTASAQARAGSA